VHTTSYTFDPTQGDFNASFRAEQDGLLHSGSTASDGRRVRNAAVHACILASVVSKKAAELAFARKGRAMTAPDVVEQIGAAFQEIHPEG
jgi:NAD(P)H-hydrate repair Nnr-like enzyme with NAD(P)H-hydrate dehydratase domain